MIRSALLLGATALSLAGCARDTGAYPSLAPRPIEKLGFAEPEAPAPAVAAPEPALDRRIADLGAQLDTIAAGFAAGAAKAEAAARAARGRPVGSDAWLEAQAGLAGLDDWRAQSSSIVTDVDQLASDRAAALAPAYPTLASLRARAQAETDREAAVIARLQNALPAA